ncbi:MAG: DMT family transporter [Firmicutes bacterium]|nr:DMT family transporter [Bacillota bacterium]
MKNRASTADILLLTAAFIWGWSFIIVKWSVALLDPYFFIMGRFLLAVIILGVIFHSELKKYWRACLKPGLILGLILGLAFIAQTWGMKYTSASASGFITSFSVVLTAVFAILIHRVFPPKTILLGILIATIGLVIIAFRDNLMFQKGDLLTLVCAIFYALHVVYLSSFSRNLSAAALTLIQLMTVMLIAGFGFLFFGKHPVPFSSFSMLHWLSILYAGVLATAFAYLLQTKAQQKLSSFRAAVILAAEPLFAAIFATSLHFDPFSWRVIIGGLLIVAGIILASWNPQQKSGLGH